MRLSGSEGGRQQHADSGKLSRPVGAGSQAVNCSGERQRDGNLWPGLSAQQMETVPRASEPSCGAVRLVREAAKGALAGQATREGAREVVVTRVAKLCFHTR